MSNIAAVVVVVFGIVARLVDADVPEVSTDAPSYHPTHFPTVSRRPTYHPTRYPTEVPTSVPTHIHKPYYGFTMIFCMLVVIAIVAYCTKRAVRPASPANVEGDVALNYVDSVEPIKSFPGGYSSLSSVEETKV